VVVGMAYGYVFLSVCLAIEFSYFILAPTAQENGFERGRKSGNAHAREKPCAKKIRASKIGTHLVSECFVFPDDCSVKA